MTQEVFVRLWNQPDRFDPGRGTLRSFLLAQSHARAVDAVRSLNARRAREAKDARRTAAAEYDMSHEAWDLALADKVAGRPGRPAARGAPGHRAGLLRRAHLRRSGRVLDTPEGTIKSRIRNGMRRMRAALVEAGVQGVDA